MLIGFKYVLKSKCSNASPKKNVAMRLYSPAYVYAPSYSSVHCI